MLNGLTITVVGMLTVFVFLAILVLAMWLLKLFVTRFLPGEDVDDNMEAVAVAIAVATDADRRTRTK